MPIDLMKQSNCLIKLTTHSFRFSASWNYGVF